MALDILSEKESSFFQSSVIDCFLAERASHKPRDKKSQRSRKAKKVMILMILTVMKENKNREVGF